MTDIIIAFPNPGDGRVLRNILVKHGHSVVGVVTSGAQAINLSDDIDYGIVICAYQLEDMQYMELKHNINESCELLLICSPGRLDDELREDENFLPMPFKAVELTGKVEKLSERLYYERKRKKKLRGVRSTRMISEAKELLMLHRGMTEPQAHKYLQSLSMSNGDTLAGTARKICLLYGKR